MFIFGELRKWQIDLALSSVIKQRLRGEVLRKFLILRQFCICTDLLDVVIILA